MNDTDITTDRRLLAATFANPADAGRCVRHLLEAGFPEAAVGIVMADSAEARQLLETGPAKPAETAAIGSAVGATLFGLAAVALAGPIGV
ncbi:MAG: hypothetical protein KDE27_10195, partial [Planctomycetes bacterium]|nr:hypothetical protein [Planctomycetota bacterium]